MWTLRCASWWELSTRERVLLQSFVRCRAAGDNGPDQEGEDEVTGDETPVYLPQASPTVSREDIPREEEKERLPGPWHLMTVSRFSPCCAPMDCRSPFG